jgi:uncharacterized membrane protein YgdD (TMEM256/DUF423 family)
MSSTTIRWIVTGALLGALGIVLGAFGAHGLEGQLTRLGLDADLPKRVANFETAVRYQMYGAVALVLVGLLLDRQASRVWNAAAMATFVGTLVFSGLLYVLVFSGPELKWLGRIVPIGGGLMILGWLGIAVGAMTAIRSQNSS